MGGSAARGVPRARRGSGGARGSGRSPTPGSCPRTIDFVDDLPRLPSGKIQRRIVREPYWAGRTKQI